MRNPASLPPRDRESGFSLLLVLAVALILSTLLLAATSRMRDLARDGNRDRASLEVLHAAEGGVEAARAALARDPGWTGGTVRVGRAEVKVAVEPLGPEAPLRSVVVVATDLSASRRLEVVLRLRKAALPTVVAWKE